MPAKPIDKTPDKTPTLETAISGFQHVFEQMKNQSASWMHYVNLQSGDFDMIKALRSAFFMQALHSKQLFVEYTSNVKLSSISLKDFRGILQKNKALCIYEYLTGLSECIYILGENTIIHLKIGDDTYQNVIHVHVLTFDKNLLDSSIKQMLDDLKSKEKDV